MTVIIPDPWIRFVCEVVFWVSSIGLMSSLIAFAGGRIVTALRHRNTFWTGVALLTSRKAKARAENITVERMGNLAMKLKTENPKLLISIHERMGCEVESISGLDAPNQDPAAPHAGFSAGSGAAD